MKGIRQERLNMLVMANEEIKYLYSFLEELRNTTTDIDTYNKVDKILNSKIEIKERFLVK
jgi:hypothetical protein